ncbi:hypothetical protein [Pseudoduganella violacea]|uniref:Uncharacterized protein n=1 Tax=Pseudoduganella violacea TaxID=1715466 RepID=A0A7W5BC48_9BURK|nr:hypothetical protein [Pseudoduganella violacea]MBB3120100.1 hypothetical protein [Pseudoduganella violacea]
MNITSLNSSSAASQLAYTGKTAQNSSTDGVAVRRPPPPDGAGLVNAVADALQSIGVSSAGDASSTGESTDSTGSTSGTSNAAQALGGFLQDLMAALHEQGGVQGGPPPYGEAGQGGIPGGAGGPGPGGGPGKLASDLQGLISKLDGGASSEDEAESDSTTLEISFKSLLQTLGSDSSDSSTQLSSFLKALANGLPNAGSSGNLINTFSPPSFPVSYATDDVFSDGYPLQLATISGNATDGYVALLTVVIAA